MLDIQLLIIDPQNDFCDPNGSLFVPGADEDMKRLSNLVQKVKDKLTDIHVTLDSHRKVDISHPIWWKDASGNHPTPFTIISAQEMRDNVWTTTQPSFFKRTLAYLEALEASGRYPHCIWPEHCLIGSEGHIVYPELFGSLQEWASRFATVDYVTKGSNMWTEHFSAVKAEVPDPSDPSTQVNTGLVDTLEQADIILFAGEALSHCIANTGRDVVDCFSNPDYIQKIHLLTDCTSNVTGFDHFGDQFLADMKSKGMKTLTCAEFLSQVI